jgi:glycosyltransferase involved in cell wall biosynthesis
LKILITTPTYPPFNSGLGNAVQRQAAVLVANGFPVVVATSGELRGQHQDEDSGALVEEFDVKGADSWLNPIRGDVASYMRFLIESDFDVVLMNAWQTWSTDLCLGNLNRMSGRKVLYSHCLSTNVFFLHQPLHSLVRYLLWRPYWWKLPERLRQLDGFIVTAAEGCDSRFDDLRVARRLGFSFAVVPNALSQESLTCLQQPVVEYHSRKELIAVGSYSWQKGHDFVLRTYALSKAKNRVPLKVFGHSFSTFTDQLRRLAESLGIRGEYVSFHEGISGAALIEEYTRSVALLSGSHTECQPLVLLDSMATGTPFVARSTGCIPTLPGGCGVRTEVEAASIIDRLITDGIEWARLSGAGREGAELKHHPDRVGQNLISALLGVMAR